MKIRWTRNSAADPIERFWSNVEAFDLDGCWLWIGGLNQTGYGRINIDGKTKLAHRKAWELTFGEIPNGKHVLHRCDQPRCCNPFHFFLGTQADNVKDCCEKGRMCLGEDRDDSKLTEEMVREIRRDYSFRKVTQKHFAKKFGVAQTNIWKVVNNRTWKHVCA